MHHHFSSLPLVPHISPVFDCFQMMYKPLKLVLLHTIFSVFVFCFYILTNVPLPSSTPPSTFPLLVMFRFGQDSHGCQHAMAYQLPVRGGIFSPQGWVRQWGGRNRSEKQEAMSETDSAFTLFLLSNCHCVSSNVCPQTVTLTSSCYWPSISYANI